MRVWRTSLAVGRVIALAALVPLMACSTFTGRQIDSFYNSNALMLAFASDYQSIDCRSCEDCEAVGAGIVYAALATQALTSEEDPDEEHYRLYARRMVEDPFVEGDQSWDNPITLALAASCGCVADQFLCPPSQRALELELEKIEAVEEYLDSQCFVSSLGTGAWEATTRNFCQVIPVCGE